MHCIIIGLGPGIGMALAHRFGREGYSLSLVARRPEALGAACTELAAKGIGAKSYPADAGKVELLRQAIAQAIAANGTPDLLIYNAAAVTPKPASLLEPEQLLRDFSTGVAGAMVAAQAVIPAMRAARKGSILFTGGGFAFEPMPNLASLGIEKAAIRNLAFALAKELAPEGIHIGTVTVGGMVKPGTPFAPELIAEEFWKLHNQPAGAFEREIVYRPQS